MAISPHENLVDTITESIIEDFEEKNGQTVPEDVWDEARGAIWYDVGAAIETAWKVMSGREGL